ncbi:hypothetical protein TNCV_1992191 [Trichonephila clavipes]|nr:hypothetical protein TNCV_1992191 [Trichonephila clavipes]
MMVHDETPAHFFAHPCDWLKMTYIRPLIIGRGPALWPQRSPDLSPMDCFPMEQSQLINILSHRVFTQKGLSCSFASCPYVGGYRTDRWIPRGVSFLCPRHRLLAVVLLSRLPRNRSIRVWFTRYPRTALSDRWRSLGITSLRNIGGIRYVHIHSYIGHHDQACVLALTSPICVLCDTGQDMTAAHLDECSALNDLNCIVKRYWRARCLMT